MSRKLLGLAIVLVVTGAADAGADDKALRQQVLALNKLTGSDPRDRLVKKLVKEKETTRKIIPVALALLKENKDALGYNAAIVLAQASGELKDLASSETFYRLGMDGAVRMQSPKMLLESFGGLNDLYLENKKYADSAKLCRELLELKTDDGKPRKVVRPITTRFGGSDFIEDDNFDSARRLRPIFHRMLIQSMAKQGKYDQALKLADNLIQANDHWMERALRGWVQREAGQLEEAVKTYEDVADRVSKDKDLEAEDRDSYVDRYKYILSGVYVDMKKIDKATDVLQELVAKHPDNPTYHNDLGYIWSDNGLKYEESEKLVRRALELDRKQRKANPNLTPEEDHDNGAYLDSLGWILFKQKKLGEAKEVLQQAVKDKSSQHIEIYSHLGDVLMALGEKEAAIAAYRRGLEVVGEGRRELEFKEGVERKLEKFGK